MIKIGLKLWSVNISFFSEIIDLYDKGFFSYIELFAVPDSLTQTVSAWKQLSIPFVIHASHSMTGLNFSKNEMLDQNMKQALEAKKFADELKAGSIIFHPGIDGGIEETVRQIAMVKDDRFIIENKPAVGLNGERCIGSSCKDIAYIMNECGTKFCLDFGHAIAAANTYNIDPLQYCRDFMQLRPVMFHLTDGEYSSEKDHHCHYGKGSFPLKEIFTMIPDSSFVTNEAKRDNPASLAEIIYDTEYTKSFFN